jgi:hypothetical protein
LAITKDAFTNTYNEFAEAEDQIINVQMAEFMESIKQLFIEKLRTDKSKDEETVLKANYLLLAKHGLPQHQESTINKK